MVKRLRYANESLNFIGFEEVQFVFQNSELKEINASLLFRGEKKEPSYIEQKMFVEKYFHSKEKVVELLKENKNIKEELNKMESGIEFKQEKENSECVLMG